VTPLSIYQEALAGSKGSAYLIETESRDSAQKLDRRKTRYRDVCNSVDDMRDTWRNKSNTLDAEPDYVPGLLADCKAIIERMDGRLHAFGELGRQVGDAAAQLKQQEKDAQSASSRTFLAALQRADAKLKITKIVPIARALATAGKLEEKVARHKEVRLNVKELDAMAESMRDVANHQERQLKKLRDAALQLAEVCAKQRKAAPDRLKPLVTSIGRDCRKVLRNRDPEE
jgi:DNA repair exonuclease SbcCD ATPase subunit